MIKAIIQLVGRWRMAVGRRMGTGNDEQEMMNREQRIPNKKMPSRQPSTFNHQPSTFLDGRWRMAVGRRMGTGNDEQGMMNREQRIPNKKMPFHQPSTFNHQPSTFLDGRWRMAVGRKKILSTSNIQHSTFNFQLSTIHYPLSLIILLLASCSVNKAKVDDSLKTHFDAYQADGCFTLFNNADGKVTVYNMYYDTMRFTPASTFKIVNSLIGLETGVITDEKMLIRWDSVQRGNADWNKDLTMEEAFKVSAVPYYQEVARRIGRDKMQFWLDSLHYGNQRITGPLDSFWLNNTLKISPDEQLGLVKRLYFDQLPFQKRTQQIVRDVMIQESNTQYTLAYKTGWGFNEPGHHIGWITGWIEENRHPYFFVLLVKSEDKNFDMRTARLAILKNILKQYGFFEGKK